MVRFVCHGCGAVVDAAAALPFRCPDVKAGDGIDHLLVPADGQAGDLDRAATNPYLRYRAFLSPYRLALAWGLSDAAWTDIVHSFDLALAGVDKGFRLTPMTEEVGLAHAAGVGGRLLVKDETGNVGGSHKARHLALVMLYLRVVQAAKLPAADGISARRLAIASCGNAALAASVIARASDWPIDVFIPSDASPAVVAKLTELGASLNVCERRAGEQGDPCYLRFQEAVAKGAIPFGVQGPDNGLAVEGGRTLAFELAEGFTEAGFVPPNLYVQVGGGALASGLAQGLAIARVAGLMAATPRLIAVQTEGCAPLERAWKLLDGVDLADAAKAKPRFMWPWEQTPHSLAHGILDDETYDWWAIAKGMRESGGRAVVAPEADVVQAHKLASTLTNIPVSATGSAGLAGLLADRDKSGAAAVVFSGLER